ncbi:CCE_0567 family metalloprotein [Phormidium nigroviride]
MAQAEITTLLNPSADELKTQIKRLNSKAGQMKMDLHDLAEGLPANYENLMDLAAETYEIYRQLNDLKQQLKTQEEGK